MIVVDTSVWIEYLRPGTPRLRQLRSVLDGLLDDDQVALPIPVRIELLTGTGKRMQATLRRVLSALPTYVPTAETWQRLETWAIYASEKGYHFGFGDLLIAALAVEHHAQVWSLDADFVAMAKLDFLQCFTLE